MLLFAAAALLYALLFNKRLLAELTAGTEGMSGSLCLLVFGAKVMRIRFRFGIKKHVGPFVAVGKGAPRPLFKKKRGGMRRGVRLLSFLGVRTLCVRGRLGFEGAPDVSVLLSGLLFETICAAAAFLSPESCDLKFKPELQKTAFDLKVEGILVFSPGRLILEIIKSKRRKQ